MTNGSNGIVFPWFTYENHEPLSPWLGLKEMRDGLVRGEFGIKQIFDIEGQLLDPEISSPPVNYVRFEVSLPKGWALVEGFDGYGLRDCTLLHLVDAEGHLRGHVGLDWDNDMQPEKAEFYCRYALNPFGGFYNRRIVEAEKDDIVDVVVDRAGVRREKPHDFPIVAHFHARPAKKGPLAPPSIDEFKKWLDEDAERVRSGRPRLDPPVYRWLHENHPDWCDPFAYW